MCAQMWWFGVLCKSSCVPQGWFSRHLSNHYLFFSPSGHYFPSLCPVIMSLCPVAVCPVSSLLLLHAPPLPLSPTPPATQVWLLSLPFPSPPSLSLCQLQLRWVSVCFCLCVAVCLSTQCEWLCASVCVCVCPGMVKYTQINHMKGHKLCPEKRNPSSF